MISKDNLWSKPYWSHLSPAGVRFVRLVGDGGVSAEEDLYSRCVAFNSQFLHSWGIACKFQCEEVVPSKEVLLATLYLHVLQVRDEWSAFIDCERDGFELPFLRNDLVNHESSVFCPYNGFSYFLL